MASSESALFRSLLFPALLLLITCSASAQVAYVDQNAPGPDHDGTSWDTAFLTIQEGVDAATPGGEVWVADGAYVENVVMGEGVAIYGGFLGAEPGGYETELDQRNFVDNVTTIDGNQSGSCVVMAVDACVDGFTVTSGSGTEDPWGRRSGGGFYCEDLSATGVIANNTITGCSARNGGGICCREYSSPAVTGNMIMGNSAGYYGGGIFCERYSSPTVTNNTMTSNTGGHGGGIYCYWYSAPTITGNTITGSTAGDGGGIYCSQDSAPTITGNMLVDNSVGGYGGGIFCLSSSPTVTGNTVMGNLAFSAGGMFCQSSSPTVTGNAIMGNLAAWRGGGIYCYDYSSPTVAGNTIMGNSGGDYGGGILCYWHSSPTVTGNTIAGNSAALGGGICCYARSSPTVTGNTIAGNSAASGGGIYCHWDSSPTVAGSTITENAADHGGGVYCWRSCSPRLTNNTISGNSATNGSAVACDSSHQVYPSSVTVTNSILWDGGNEVWNNDDSTITITYSDVQGGWPGEGNIDADPMFANPDAGDFHLRFDSPCIDAGTNEAPELPETDWDGEDRIANGVVDIGADEFFPCPVAAPDPQPGCQGPLFGEPKAGFPGWVWFSIPLTPVHSGEPNDVLGFEVNGRLHGYDKYAKAPMVYRPPFTDWELAVGDSYVLWLEGAVANPSYEGISPFVPWQFEYKLGRQGWTWVGMPGAAPLEADDFLDLVRVQYPSDPEGAYRTAGQDCYAIPDNWVTWVWPFWNTSRQCAEFFFPHGPFGHDTCHPWIGYRVWVKVGAATDEDDPDQVTLIWPRTGG